MTNENPATGPLTLLLLPGMDGAGSLFGQFAAALGPHLEVRVVRYPPAAALGYAALEEIAAAALPATGPFAILGESFSGPIAISLAAAHPDRLVALLLCVSFARNPLPPLTLFKPLLGMASARHAPSWLLDFWLFGRSANATLRGTLKTALAPLSNAAMRARLAAVLAVDVSAKLATLRAPVLYLRARHDRIVPPSAATEIVRRCPQTQIELFDAPHCLLQVCPEQAAQVVRDFLAAASAPSNT